MIKLYKNKNCGIKGWWMLETESWTITLSEAELKALYKLLKRHYETKITI